MRRALRNSLILWGGVTCLIILQFIWTYSRHGLAGFRIFMQEAIYTHIPITLASVALIWLLSGFLLWLILAGRITASNGLTWAGFFVVAFLYINLLRERVRYGDIDYYTQAAFALAGNQPLPDFYLYPPLWATLLSFLTPLGEDGILLIAWIANVLALLLFYFLLQRILARYHFSPQAAAFTATLFILVNMPVIRTLVYVQVNLHMMNLIFLSILLYRDRLFLSALALALAVHLKASPAVLILAFVLDLNWKWIAAFAASMILVAALTVMFYGVSPFMDFINNFLLLSAPSTLSMHDSSFDSAIGMALSYFRADPVLVRILIYLAKGFTVLAGLYLCVRPPMFFSNQEAGLHLYNSIIPLFVVMTLASPLVWEHHAIFLALPFLLLMKKLDSPTEWISYGAAYMLVFLLPAFDFFPWSYGRLPGMLILLTLLWVVRDRGDNAFFPAFNAWAESLLNSKIWAASKR
ncbi:MAG TPA: glycosyltransferase 87 family protein [Anaerolineales bacterium]|nr:glycosyltransferase 87 family protein [Anaerolineales bacterium]